MPLAKVIAKKIRIIRNLKNSTSKMRRDVVINIIYAY